MQTQKEGMMKEDFNCDSLNIRKTKLISNDFEDFAQSGSIFKGYTVIVEHSVHSTIYVRYFVTEMWKLGCRLRNGQDNIDFE